MFVIYTYLEKIENDGSKYIWFHVEGDAPGVGR
jgi:hypothetical protein